MPENNIYKLEVMALNNKNDKVKAQKADWVTATDKTLEEERDA